MTSPFKRHTLLACAACCTILPLPAWAQQARSDTTEREEGDEQIIVSGRIERVLDMQSETGSRLNLTPRETPAAIDVLTQERFLERGLRTSNDALNSAAGVTEIDTGGGTSFSVRGFGGGAISTNYDGVHQPSTMTQRNYDSFAFERIEVLKGPSSVLYGEGAIGGAINYVPKKPILGTAAFTGLGQYGSRDTFRIAADANMPVNETVAMRGVVSYSGTDGYIDRTPSEMFTGNLGVMLQPSSDLSIFLQAEYFWADDGSRYWGTPLIPENLAIDPSDLVSTANGRALDNARRNVNYQYADGQVVGDSTWLRSQIVWNISDTWTLRNDLSYNEGERLWRDAEFYSFAAATGLINRQPIYIRNPLTFWNERIALSSDSQIARMRNRFLIGYEHTDNDHLSVRRFGPVTLTPANLDNSAPGLFPEITPANFPGAGNFADAGAVIKVDAIFAENALNLTDELLIVAGGRYEWMHLDRTIDDYNLDTTSSFEKEYEPFSYRVGAVYDLAQATQVYTQWTQAAAPVGTLVLLSLGNSAFELTKGKSAEVGLKSSFWNGRVDLTVSGYWIKQDDIITRDPSNPNVSFQGGSQSSRGVELGLAAAVTSEFRLDANVAVLDAHYDELIEAGGVDRAGKTPVNVPETVVNLFGAYQFRQIPIKLTAGMRYSSELFGDNANTIRIQGNTVFDASIGYTFENIGDLTLRARNLTDETYIEWGGSSTVYLGAPRTIDLTFRTRL